METRNRPISRAMTRSWNDMKSISDCMSPLSWMFCNCASFFPLLIILRPTLKEFMVGVIVDLIAFQIHRLLEKKLFLSFYPDAALYFDGIDDTTFQKFSLKERVDLLESFFLFPKRRALFCLIFAFVKVSPAMLVMIFYWKHTVSLTTQALLVLGIEWVVFWFFSSAVFIEAHIYISKLISSLHEKHDLSDAFKTIKTHYSNQEFAFQEIVNFSFIMFFTIVLQWTTINGSPLSSPRELGIKISSIAFIALLLLGRLWYLNRSYFIGGLERLFEHMELLDYRKGHLNLPIHSSPLLAKFENTFNLLTERLKVSEQELASLVFWEADKSRYRALGEMSALIAHDLNGPLHVAQFCANQLMETPEKALENPNYLVQLTTNIEQAVDLATSLRARIKNPSSNPFEVSLKEGHDHVIRLLETQYHSDGFKKVRVAFDENLNSVRVAVSRVDLIHILDNLYRNSIENMLKNDILKPCLEIQILKLINEELEILIADNGTGLNLERFEDLTAFQFTRDQTSLPSAGLGLRLTRRLIELNKGSLTLLQTTDFPGTRFKLKLKIAHVVSATQLEETLSASR